MPDLGTATTKPLPPARLDLLIYAGRDSDYRHFADGAAHPFDHTAEGFARVNAWWLADAALLAYWEGAAGTRIWSSAGFVGEFFTAPGTQCYVASNDRLVIVSFRGTEPDERQDVLDIINLGTAPWTLGGKVHRGFLDQFTRIWPLIRERVDALSQTRRVFFTGHSLGAALATLALDAFGRGQAYTYGSPLVGNRAFVSGFNQRHRGRSFRFANDGDLVTFIPPPGWLLEYAHVDDLKFIDGKGGIWDKMPSLWTRLSLSSHAAKAQRAYADLEAGRVAQLPPALADHIPSRYAVRVWNDYVAR